MKRKIPYGVLRTLGVCLVMGSLMGTPVYAKEAPIKILEQRDEKVIANGLKFEEVSRLTDKGWVDYYILRMNVNQPDIEFEIVVNEDPYGKRAELTELSRVKDVVAAINGDFYLSYLTETDSLGVTLDDNELIAGFDVDHELEAGQYTFMQSLIGGISIDVLDINYYLVNSKGKKIDLGAYNKVSSLHLPTYIDSRTMKDTSSMDKQYEGIYKIIVEDGVITDITTDTKTVKVPENGYLITMNYGFYAEAVKDFKVGQKVFMVPQGSVDLEKLEFAISGGGQIVKDNKIVAEPGLEVKSDQRHPRTAIGISQDKQEAIMVVLDGRGKSIGATDGELAAIMIEEGAVDAMLLDGGGSSEMIYKDLGKTEYTIANTPSEGKERRITNGIGVKNNAPQVDTIGGIEFNIPDDIYYTGDTITLAPTMFDSNYHAMNFMASNAKVTLSGIDGFTEGLKVYPLSEGEATITMTYNGHTSIEKIHVIDKDELRKDQNELLEQEGYKFAFVGTTAGKNTLLDHIVEDKMIASINDKADMAFFVGDSDIKETDMSLPYFTWSSQYSVIDFENIRTIQLATDKGGITKTDPNQWNQLKDSLASAPGDMVFVTLNKNPLTDTYIDYKEKEMLQEQLSQYVANSGKKVFVISGSGYTTTHEEIKGVNYINLNGLWYKAQGQSLDLQESFYMVLFNVDKENISFSLESIY